MPYGLLAVVPGEEIEQEDLLARERDLVEARWPMGVSSADEGMLYRSWSVGFWLSVMSRPLRSGAQATAAIWYVHQYGRYHA